MMNTILLAILAACILMPYLHDYFRIYRTNKRALKFFKNHEYEKAQSLFLKVSRFRPWLPRKLFGSLSYFIFMEILHFKPWLSRYIYDISAHYYLGMIYQSNKQYAQAIEQFQASLKGLEDLNIARTENRQDLEAYIHLYLVNCYEEIGDDEQADRELQLTVIDCEEEPTGKPSFLVRGRLLRREGKFLQAAQLYDRILSEFPDFTPEERMKILISGTLCYFNCGRQADCQRVAEQAIALRADPKQTGVAYRMAGIAAGNLGQYDTAEDYQRHAYQLALEQRDNAGAVGSLVMISSLLRRRGEVTRALKTLDEATPLTTKSDSKRNVFFGRYDCLFTLGQFDAARDVLQQARIAEESFNRHSQRRLDGIQQLAFALLEGHAGNIDDARTAIDTARVLFARDEKMTTWCRAYAAWIYAMAGETATAQNEIAELEAVLPTLSQQPDTRVLCLDYLGRTTCILGNYERAIVLLTQLLDEHPDPIDYPEIWYYLGECHRLRGDQCTARAAYQQSVNRGFGIHFEKLATERLAEMSEP